MSTKDRLLLAVLIDADNISAQDAEPILDEIKRRGEPALRRVYGDWSKKPAKKDPEEPDGWIEAIRKFGLVAYQTTANTTGKNASDIGLVIDAMDILHGQRFDGFVLVSSDSDFTALANRLREAGQHVIGIGEEKAPDALRNVCNRFILIENLRPETSNVKNGDQDKRAAEKDKKPLNHAFQRISNAMKNIEDDDGWYNLSQVKNAISAAHPDFDQRSYGFSKFSELVRALSDKFSTKSEGKTIFVCEKSKAH